MNWKAWAPLVVAITLALVAGLVAQRMMSRVNVAQPEDTNFTKVAMVTRDLAPGSSLSIGDVELREIGLDAPPAGTFTTTTELVDRVTTAPLLKGQPILQSLLAPEGTAAGLSALVPKGKRAITVDVNETSGLAGMLLPGAYVDVLATITGGGDEEGSTARTIVQNVKVMAVGQRLTPEQKQPGDNQPGEMARSVTLEVTPEQAETIELSAMTSRPRLVLRADGDDKQANTSGITLVDLRGKRASAGAPVPATPVSTDKPAFPGSPFDIFNTKQPEAKAPQNDPFNATTTREVKIIRGGQESTVTFEVPAAPSWMTGVSLEPAVK